MRRLMHEGIGLNNEVGLTLSRRATQRLFIIFLELGVCHMWLKIIRKMQKKQEGSTLIFITLVYGRRT